MKQPPIFAGRIPAGAVALLGLACAAYLWFQMVQANALRHNNDFKHIYVGVRAVAAGIEPYSAPSLMGVAAKVGLRNASLNPYVYLPFTAQALAPLGWLPFAEAAAVWFLTSHAMALAALTLCCWRQRRGWWLAAAGMGYLALHAGWTRSLTAGQLNAPLLLMLAAALAAERRGRERLAAVLLACGTLFKLLPGLFGLYYMAARRWRALGTFAATGFGLFAASALASGWRMQADFLPMLRQMSFGRSTWQEYGATFWKDPANQSPNSMLTHLLAPDARFQSGLPAWGQGAANAATWALALALLAVLIYQLSRTYGPRAAATFHERDFHLATVTALLLPSIYWDHYTVLLLPCQLWLLGRAAGSRRVAGLLAAVSAVLAAPIAWESPALHQGWGLLILSAKGLATFALWGLVLAAKEQTALDPPAAPSADAAEPAPPELPSAPESEPLRA